MDNFYRAKEIIMTWILNQTPTANQSTNDGFIDLTKSSKNEIMVKMKSSQILKISNENNSIVTNLACHSDGAFRVQIRSRINGDFVQNVDFWKVRGGIFISGNGNSSFGGGGDSDGNFGKNLFNYEEIDLSKKEQTEIMVKLRSNQVLKIINNLNQSNSMTTTSGELAISSNGLKTIGSTGLPPALSAPLQNFPAYFVSSPDPSEYPEGVSVSRNNSTFRANNCTIEGCNNTIEGNRNTLKGDSNLLFGSNNKVQGHNNEARGNLNEFFGGRNNKSVGTGNKFTGCIFNNM